MGKQGEVYMRVHGAFGSCDGTGEEILRRGVADYGKQNRTPDLLHKKRECYPD